MTSLHVSPLGGCSVLTWRDEEGFFLAVNEWAARITVLHNPVGVHRRDVAAAGLKERNCLRLVYEIEPFFGKEACQ